MTGQGEAREQIARAVSDRDVRVDARRPEVRETQPIGYWTGPLVAGSAEALADAVLAVADALAAVERCSQLAERWESTHFGRELRRALGGPE